MVGRPGWRRSAAFAGGIALTASVLFAVTAPQTNAQQGPGLLNRVRNGIRLFAGAGQTTPVPEGVRVESRSARAISDEFDRKARDPFLIHVGNVSFDPMKGIALPQGLPAELAASSRSVPAALASAPSDVDYWIVQYEGPAGEARKGLEAAGVQLVGVIPNNAYLVRADGPQVQRMQVEASTRWVGRFLPAWKLDDRVRTFFGVQGDPARLPLDTLGLVRLSVRLHPGVTDEEFAAYYDAAKQMPGTQVLSIDPTQELRGSRLLLGVEPASVETALVQLAGFRDVAAVTTGEMPHVHNDHAVWFIQGGNDATQTANYATSAPLFVKGVTGRGLLGAVADTGLENDMCFFRYSAVLADVGYPLGQSADAVPGNIAATVPDEDSLDLAPGASPVIRTRDRKVVAYYLQGGAVEYADPSQHGTGVAGSMAGDNFAVLAARPLLRDLGERQNIRFWRAGGEWTPGQELRADLQNRVDDVTDPLLPGADDPDFTDHTYGNVVEHHQARDGMAPGAQIVFQDIGDESGALPFTPTHGALFIQSVITGATVHNASFGGTPCLDPCYGSGGSDQADDVMWSRRTFVSFVSAGNDGNSGAFSLGRGIAHGKNVVAVGWSDAANQNSCPLPGDCPLGGTPRLGHSMNAASSRGPASGGGIAPLVSVPGTVQTSAAENQPSPIPENGFGTGDGGCGVADVDAVGGTSFSSPVAAGAGLLIQQYFYDGYFPSGVATPADALRPTNALVRAVLVNSARNLEGARTDDTGNGQAPRPNFGQGWGAPRLDDTLFFVGDPKRGPIDFQTERARLAVLNDVPNGFIGDVTDLVPEPGGRTRNEILNGWNPAFETDRTWHEYFLDVVNDSNGDTLPDPDDLANELRFTLAWSDVVGNTPDVPLVNNLDLEVVGPGPDGILESNVRDGVRGDDVVYRPKPDTATWQDGYTLPSPDAEITTLANMDSPFADTDMLNTVENVFIPADEVQRGTYLIRVIARDIRAFGGVPTGWPNFHLNDQAASRDTDGDTVPDVDLFDTIRGEHQGYALIASGNFTTEQGILAMNQSGFGCRDEVLTLSLNDANGGASVPPCGTELEAIITTTTPLPSFPSDLEIATFTGTGPTYRSSNDVLGTDGFAVVLVQNPSDVIHRDGIIQVVHGETIVAEYTDNAPCGGAAFAQATVSCAPAVTDQGFLIADGCDYAVPGDPSSGVRPDEFMDIGERNRYQVFLANAGGTDLVNAVVSLYPDPLDAYASLITVEDSPQRIGLLPPGRVSDHTFFVSVGAGVPPRHQMDFIVEVSAPENGLLFPTQFRQTQILEADVISFRYDTRDPNGELWGKGRIQELKPGVTEIPGDLNPASDYVTNEPMWFDPEANPGSCDTPRNLWPGPNTPPAGCTRNGNPTNPWDFDDSNDGWFEAAHDGDDALTGVNLPNMWFWKNAPTGGGCGWEDELHRQLAPTTGFNPLPAGHPDRIAQPWGIWHTGQINNGAGQVGPWIGNPTSNQGMPYLDQPSSVNDHTIMWDPPPPVGITGSTDSNTAGNWCNTYLSQPSLARQFYRSMFMAPTLFRVHASNPTYTVEFQKYEWYSRLDGHTRNPDNVVAFGWFVSNQPVPPASTTPLSYSWAQFQDFTNIFTDSVEPDWSVDDNKLGQNLRNPSTTFGYLTYEDIFGPAADSWNVALGWTHIHVDNFRSRGQYGAGVDDVSFVWTESRDDVDGSDCAQVEQRPIIWFGENRYNACQGTLQINLWAPDETRARIAVAVRSAAEDFETAILDRQPNGRYYGEMTFTSDTNDDAVGILLVSAGTQDIGNGADQISVEYDPRSDSDLATDPAERADWCDADGNEINDDDDGDGVPNCEDDPAGEFEVRDFSAINCTSGAIFYIRHELQQAGLGDNDRFADPGETLRMKLFLVSAIGADLEDAEVRISTNDPVSLITDTVQMDVLPGNGTIVDTGFGFEFCVPLGMQTTSLDAPRTLTFRIDVRGRNTTNLNEFSTAGEAFNSFLPLEAWMLVDVDEVATNADYTDGVHAPVPPAGTFFEGFNGDQIVNNGLDHVFAANFQPGVQLPLHDTTADTRFGMAGNGGFCPECDVQDDCSVEQDNCEYYFASPDNTAFTPGYPVDIEPPWNPTDSWAHEGLGSFKFGKVADPSDDSQHYPQGVYASVQLPPLRIASTASQPMLSWWQIVNFWTPFFTNGLFTPIDGAVIEIAPSAIGVGDTGTGSDDVNRSQPARINQRFPLSNFRRVSPFEGFYDFETDALNACRTLFCRYKHPVFATQGSPTVIPAGNSVERGVAGTPGTWKLSRVDLSDFRGMEIVIQFSAEVLQDLDVQNGNFGWLIDEVTVTGVSRRMAIRLQPTNLTQEACGIVADFAAESPACFGEDVQFLDRHSGVGSFDTSVTPSVPYPLQYEWRVGSLVLTGMGGDLITGVAGVYGTYDNPRINFQEAAGISGPQSVPVTLTITQNGVSAPSVTHAVIYKDAPVPVLDAVSGAYVGGRTQMSADVQPLLGLDPDRTLFWTWDFGDGTGADASGASVEHVYATAGSYVVRVTVRDEDGCSGTATQTVVVTGSPLFERPAMTTGADPDCGTPFGGDNNADIEEIITAGISFRNATGAAQATDIVGYLSSPDDDVEIVTSVADFGGPYNGGDVVPARNFRFIVHDDGTRPAPSCLVVPFQLTLVANGGSVVQVLDLSFAMGVPTFEFFDNTGTQTGGFARSSSGPSQDEEVYSVASAGCLTGLELAMDLTSSAPAVMADLSVSIIPPDGDAVTVQFPNGPADEGPLTLAFRFGADNATAPIADTAGQLVQVPPTVLDPSVEAGLVSSLVGRGMAGNWTIRVGTTRLGNPTATYDFTIREFRLEGTSSANLEIGNPLSCTDACFGAGAAPVFDGARTDCDFPNRVVFMPAVDAWTCDGVSDVTYELWASTTPGQIGTRVDGTSREVTDCASCTDPAGGCAIRNPDGASYWEVCNTEEVFWTVIAVDGSGARTPNVGAGGDPGTYQTDLASCAEAIFPPGVFAITKTGSATATAWLQAAPLRTWPLGPPANATSYRILRGTFPTVGGRAALLSARGVPYDHVVRPGDCSFTALSRDVSSDLTLPGSYYYLIPGINSLGCGGMGTDSEGSGRPGDNTGCPSDDDCIP